MTFDSDVLIWAIRDHAGALAAVDAATVRRLSIVSRMELIRGVRNKREAHDVLSFLGDLGFDVLPLTEAIGHRAALYIDEHALSHAPGVADALIAATVVEHGETLLTANVKHYKPLSNVTLKRFRP